MRTELLNPVLEKVGNTALQVGEIVGKQYVISNVLHQWSKWIIAVVLVQCQGQY